MGSGARGRGVIRVVCHRRGEASAASAAAAAAVQLVEFAISGSHGRWPRRACDVTNLICANLIRRPLLCFLPIVSTRGKLEVFSREFTINPDEVHCSLRKISFKLLLIWIYPSRRVWVILQQTSWYGILITVLTLCFLMLFLVLKKNATEY